MKKYKYLIFDLDWTLINSTHKIIDIIEDYFLDKYPDYYDTARYYIENSQWQSLQEQLEAIFKEKELAEKVTKKLYTKLNKLRDKIHFIPWVQDTIKELSKNYKLFLTTWSSTKFAKQTLKDWDIKKHFELIYWSDEILKWRQHLELFKDYSLDEDFHKESLYIWDWEMDKIFAKESWIDFIRVWTRWTEDETRINSVKDINNII